MSASKYPFTSFPSGWFSVGLSKELVAGKVISKKIFDQEIVIFRTSSGIVSAIDAYCPHLGAHLGHGGKVEDECIRCPFHGLLFDKEGNCVADSCEKNKRVHFSIKKWKVCEKLGAIFVWYDKEGLEPHWEIPNINTEGWSPYESRSWILRTHAQDTNENALDLSHFVAIHDQEEPPEIIERISTQDHTLRVHYKANRLWLNKILRGEIKITMYGLGLLFQEAILSDFAIHFYLLSFTTPIDKDFCSITFISGVDQAKLKIHSLLKWIPRRLLVRILSKIFANHIAKVAQQDFSIWENKKYVESPCLLRNENQIGVFRRWVKQFYKT